MIRRGRAGNCRWRAFLPTACSWCFDALDTQCTLPRTPFLVLIRTPCPIALDPLPFHVMILIQHALLTLARAALMRSTLHSCARPADPKLLNDAKPRLLPRADRPRPRSSRARTRSQPISFPPAARARPRTVAGRGSAPPRCERVEARRAGAGLATWVGWRRGKPRGCRGGRTGTRVRSSWLACDMVHFHDICHVQHTVYPKCCMTLTHVNAPF
mmetsp:Transcript_64999/g.128512  ORF Transcript_64999/g.128512 Transcript_64999/m.128512 type:complete len:214 (-) Transcript_64999:38-679(-)